MQQDAISPAAAVGASRGTWLLATFAATLFLSALLLFSVQPLFARMVLPRLGGTPAVWSVAMVFFQATLLAGYLYAHLLIRHLGVVVGLAVHALVLAAGLLFLPIGVASGWDVPPGHSVPVWLLAVFAASIGAPFFAVSASAPLLQAWFARTGHPHSADPYFLYGASNIGSFAALLCYPVVIEPLLTLGTQARLWTVAYVVLAAALLGCAALAQRTNAAAADMPPKVRLSAVTWKQRAQWVVLAALPSALLVAITANISTNIAAAPFLWVLPLALFLFTFVLVFRTTPLVPARLLQIMTPAAFAAAMILGQLPYLLGALAVLSVSLFSFTVIAMAWHSELFARRPAAVDLTEFYLFMSLGGVLGGAFTSLAAPVIFESVIEHDILLCVSLLILPEARRMASSRAGIAAGLVAAAALFAARLSDNADFRDRSFFGVVTVQPSEDARFRLLVHGNIVHGAESMTDLAGGKPGPLTYYTPEGPMGEAVRAARNRAEGPLSVAVIGLGTGSLACHAHPGESWRFYEIDPAVIRVAADPRLFTFMSECAPGAPVIAGDARLTMANEPAGGFDLLVVDAFSSDAIPVHLLTREVLALYAAKLKPGGSIVFHISNRYMELASVLAATAAAEGLGGAWIRDVRSKADNEAMRSSSEAVALSRAPAALATLISGRWISLSEKARPGVRAWSDDYSNVLGAVLRGQGLL